MIKKILKAKTKQQILSDFCKEKNIKIKNGKHV